MKLEIMIPVIVAIVAAIPGILAFFGQRRKDKTDAAEKITAAALDLVEPYQKRVAEMENQISKLRTGLAAVEAENSKLKTNIELLVKENQVLRAENNTLTCKISDMERQITDLEHRPRGRSQ
jgi:cell division protein FtsB